MKKIILLIAGIYCSGLLSAQVFPYDLQNKWDFKDESNKVIVITYDLPEFENLRYLKIVAKAYVDNRLVPMRSLRGDIGEAVKVGKAKSLEWNWENDVVELAGELRFVITADNPNPVDATISASKDDSKMNKPEIPVIKVLALPVIAGGGLAVAGILSYSGAKSDWDAMTAAQRTTEEYDSLNGKYKTGQYLAIGGGLVILAGVAWLIKEKAAINSYSSKFTIEPGVGDLTNFEINKPLPRTNFGLGLNYNF